MRLLGINLQHGGGKRLPALRSAISQLGPDLVVLSEFRASTERRLSSTLEPNTQLFSTSPVLLQNGIGILAHTELQASVVGFPVPDFPNRALHVAVGAAKVHVIAVYGPLMGEDAEAFWRTLRAYLVGIRDQHVLVTGDFNTGEAGVDCYKDPFWCSHQFVGLREDGLHDVWRKLNPGVTEHTWFSRYKGADRNGFRLDHAFASPSLLPLVTSCRYEHRFRAPGMTDHSALVVEIA